MESPIQEGAIIREKYRVERVLGQGGMGIVIAAWHLRLEQRVAIKLLRPELIHNREVVERFLREARAASKIEGDHVVRVTDVETLPDGTPFMVMEYLEGRDLAWVREQSQPLLPSDAVDYILQACEAIAEAHQHGVIHRDLKPGNIFLARRRDGRTRIKVLDFGISKLADATGASANLTGTEAIMGSAEYMSPEQMQSSRDVDERTDIWALGVCVYELCTGSGPFEAPSLREVCVRVLASAPTPPRSIRPEIPPGLEAVILRCLEKDRENRYPNVGALRAALLPFATGGDGRAGSMPPGMSPQGGLPQGAPPPGASPRGGSPQGTPPSAHSAATPSIGAAPSPSPSSPRAIQIALVATASVVALLIVVIAFVVGRGHRASETEPSPSASASATAVSAGGNGRFQLESELILDGKTGLRWQRRPPPGTMSFSAAKSYCASARGGAFRVPTQEELARVILGARQSLPVPAEVFTGAASDYYWTASPVERDPKLFWIVRSGDGDATTSSPSGAARVRCVR